MNWNRVRRVFVICMFAALLPAACSNGPGGDEDENGGYSGTDASSGDDTGTSPDGVEDPDGPDGSNGAEAPDGDDDPDGTGGGGPDRESRLIYSQRDLSVGDNSGASGAGALWLVDPSEPSGRINLSEIVGSTGLVLEVKVDASGRYVLFNQQPEPETGGEFHFADLEGENGPVVEKIYETSAFEMGFGPDAEHIWMSTRDGEELYIADIETPGEWNVISDSVEGKSGTLSDGEFQEPDPFGSDGQWVHFTAKFLPEGESTRFEGIYRARVGDTLGTPEILFDPRDYDIDGLDESFHLPSANRILVVPGTRYEKSDLFSFPAEPGAERTKVAELSFEQAPYRAFRFPTMSPDESKLGLYFSERDEEFGLNRDGMIELQVVEPTQPDSQLGSVELSYGFVHHSEWHPDSSELVVNVGPRNANTVDISPKVWHVDLESYQKTDLTGDVPAPGPLTYLGRDGFGPDGKYYFLARESDEYSKGVGIYRLDVPGGDVEKVSGMTHSDVGSFVFSADGEEIFYKTDTDYPGAYNLVAAPIDDPQNGTILNRKAEHEDELVRHLEVVGDK